MKSKFYGLLPGISFQILGLILATCAAADTQVSATHISGDVDLRSSAVDDSFEQSKIFGTAINLNATHRIDDSLSASLLAGFILESGSSQTFFSPEYKPQRELILSEAALEWKPLTNSSLKLGAINQNFHDSPLLFCNVSFPALKQQWRNTFKNFRLELTAEQAIPTADTATLTPVPTTATPFYELERIEGDFTFNNLGLDLRGSHFAFYDLPSNVANQSRFQGNSVAGVGDMGAQYLYTFSGIESGARLHWKAPAGVQATLGGDLILNLNAPSGNNRGLRAFIEAAIPVGKRTSLTPGIALFRNESDSSPGFYNSGFLAHNNRQGAALTARADIKSSALQIEGQFVKSNVINESPFQADFTGFFLVLRKFRRFWSPALNHPIKLLAWLIRELSSLIL